MTKVTKAQVLGEAERVFGDATLEETKSPSRLLHECMLYVRNGPVLVYATTRMGARRKMLALLNELKWRKPE